MSTPTPDDARTAFTLYRNDLRVRAWEFEQHLRLLAQVHDFERDRDVLAAFATINATELDERARRANMPGQEPHLERFDGFGNRIEAVAVHPDTAAMTGPILRSGVLRHFATPGDERRAIAAMIVLSENGEAGHACPIACAAGLVKLLRRAPHAPEEWSERLLSTDPTMAWRASQFLTEVQGGSDVGANAVVAEADPSAPHKARLSGEKWFCSVADADLFLVTARDPSGRAGTAGVGAYVVPRLLYGAPNGFFIRRMKDKLGTRSMASAEIDFVGASAVRVGDFRDVVEVVLGTSRVMNAACSAGITERAARECRTYAAHRRSFGRPILEYPMVRRTVARVEARAWVARALVLACAALGDRLAAAHDTADAGALRMLVNLTKVWTSRDATTAVREAMEVFGGNGAIETFTVLPRLLRDSVVTEAWEGGHDILALQAMRDARRLGLHTAMFALLRRWDPRSPHIDAVEESWDELVAGPEDRAVTFARDAADLLFPVAARAALRCGLPAGTNAALDAVVAMVDAGDLHPSAGLDPNRQQRADALLELRMD